MLAANDHPSLEPTPATLPGREYSRPPNALDMDQLCKDPSPPVAIPTPRQAAPYRGQSALLRLETEQLADYGDVFAAVLVRQERSARNDTAVKDQHWRASFVVCEWPVGVINDCALDVVADVNPGKIGQVRAGPVQSCSEDGA